MHRASKWLVAALVLLGALVLAVGGPTTASPLQSQVGAYLTDRNLALATVLVALLFTASARTLGTAVLITAGTHALDAGFDVYFRSFAGVVGSIVFTVLFLAAAAWLLRQPDRRLFAAPRSSAQGSDAGPAMKS